MEPGAAFLRKAYDWKAGFPPSIRLLNTALMSSENDFYSTSSLNSEYLAKVNDYLQMMRRDSNDSQDASSSEEISVPNSYFMTEPISPLHMVYRCSLPGQMKLAVQVLYRNPETWPNNKAKFDIGGPYETLIQRHDQITHCLEKLFHLFLCKLHTIQSIQASTPYGTVLLSIDKFLTNAVQASCHTLTVSLKKLGEKLKLQRDEHEDLDLKIKCLEDFCQKCVQLVFSEFIEYTSGIILGVGEQAQTGMIPSSSAQEHTENWYQKFWLDEPSGEETGETSQSHFEKKLSGFSEIDKPTQVPQEAQSSQPVQQPKQKQSGLDGNQSGDLSLE